VADLPSPESLRDIAGPTIAALTQGRITEDDDGEIRVGAHMDPGFQSRVARLAGDAMLIVLGNDEILDAPPSEELRVVARYLACPEVVEEIVDAASMLDVVLGREPPDSSAQ